MVDGKRLVRTPVRVERVELRCSQCDEGTMRSSGFNLSSMPPQYLHECTHCKYAEYLKGNYPYTAHIAIKEET